MEKINTLIEIAEKIISQFEKEGKDFDAWGVVGSEGIPLLTVILALFHQKGKVKKGFYLREEKKGYGTNQRVEGLPPSPEEKSIILLLPGQQIADIEAILPPPSTPLLFPLDTVIGHLVMN